MPMELVTQLPYDHPYRWDGTRFGGPKLWRPTEIATALWLDAEDTSTITLNGSTVSQWRDKSGNGRNAVQAVAAAQPTYQTTGLNSKPTINFDGSNDVMAVSGLPTILQPMSVFIVMNNYVGGIGDANLYRSNDEFLAVGYRAGGAAQWTIFAGTALNNVSAYTAAPTIRHDVFDGTSSQIRRDGTAYASGNAGTLRLITAGSSFNIGAGVAAAASASVKLGEFLIFNRALTTDETQKLEGYAAWKWGLQANLPADHPYKTLPPTV